MTAYTKLKDSLPPGIKVSKVYRHPNYAVTDHAIIYDISGKEPVIVPQHRAKSGYYIVWLKQGKRAPKMRPVHKIVAQAFLVSRPSKEYLIRHLDGDCHNNHAKNLRWGTVKENAEDRMKHNADRKRLTDSEVKAIRKRIYSGEDPEVIAKKMGLSFFTINGILHKRTYKKVK